MLGLFIVIPIILGAILVLVGLVLQLARTKHKVVARWLIVTGGFIVVVTLFAYIALLFSFGDRAITPAVPEKL